MRNILSRNNREVLEQFAWSRALVAFDFDGTLAPIVREPDAAQMRATTRRLLRAVCQRYPTMVISGRARADVAGRVRGVGLRAVVGNHGIEPGRDVPVLCARVASWSRMLANRLDALRGVVIEEKGHSIAVHYRASRSKKLAKRAIFEAAGALGEARLIRGKQVLNILPPDAPHKGIALERARARLGCDTAIYVGDDETDEDVFRMDDPGRLLGIRIGAKRSSAAAYCLAGQREVDALLRELVRCRSTGPRGARHGA